MHVQSLYTALGIVQIAVIALWAKSGTIRTNASVANSVITFLGYLSLLGLSIIEHHRSIRPSLIIEAYLLLTLLFDAAHVRTLWLQGYNNSVAAATTVTFAFKVVLLCLEAISKRSILRSEYQWTSTEATAGLISKGFFLWQNPLLLTGFSKSLTVDTLLPLDKHLSSWYLYSLLRGKNRKKPQRTLLLRYFHRLGWHLLSVAPPRLGLIAFNFCQPFLIQRAISFSEEPDTQASKNVGYALIGAYFLVYTGIAVTMGQYQHLTYRAITMARGGLISTLFVKASTLKANEVDSAQAMTLMSADIERITNGWQTMHEMWANSIEIALAIWLLERQLGAACAIPLAVAIGESTALMTVDDAC